MSLSTSRLSGFYAMTQPFAPPQNVALPYNVAWQPLRQVDSSRLDCETLDVDAWILGGRDIFDWSQLTPLVQPDRVLYLIESTRKGLIRFFDRLGTHHPLEHTGNLEHRIGKVRGEENGENRENGDQKEDNHANIVQEGLQLDTQGRLVDAYTIVMLEKGVDGSEAVLVEIDAERSDTLMAMWGKHRLIDPWQVQRLKARVGVLVAQTNVSAFDDRSGGVKQVARNLVYPVARWWQLDKSIASRATLGHAQGTHVLNQALSDVINMKSVREPGPCGMWQWDWGSKGCWRWPLGPAQTWGQLAAFGNHDLAGRMDFNKGCYLGQEVASRMHRLGKIRRRLVALEAIDPLVDVLIEPVEESSSNLIESPWAPGTSIHVGESLWGRVMASGYASGHARALVVIEGPLDHDETGWRRQAWRVGTSPCRLMGSWPTQG